MINYWQLLLLQPVIGTLYPSCMHVCVPDVGEKEMPGFADAGPHD